VRLAAQQQQSKQERDDPGIDHRGANEIGLGRETFHVKNINHFTLKENPLAAI
jgi:hypothetical protein